MCLWNYLLINYCLLTCFEWILTVIWANKFVLVSTGFARTCTTLGLVTVDTYRQWRFLSGEKYRFLSDWENKNNKFVVHKLQTKKSAIPLVWTVWGKAACTSLSLKQCLSPCSGPTPVYLDMRTPMINLLKKTIVDLPIMIRLKRIPNALLIICRVHWEPSTRISGFLCRSYWPEFYYVYHVGKGKENLFNIRMF